VSPGRSGSGAAPARWQAARRSSGRRERTPRDRTAAPSAQLELTGNLRLPATSATAGQIWLGGTRFLHSSGTQSTFLGPSSGNLATTGTDLVGLGWRALQQNTTGVRNTAAGSEAMRDNSTGTENAALGWLSLSQNTTASENVAIGAAALRLPVVRSGNGGLLGSGQHGRGNGRARIQPADAITNGIYNSAFGLAALNQNTIGFENTGLGTAALYGNTSGHHNTAVGARAGSSLTTGSYNVDIANLGVADESGTIRIGDSNQTRAFVAGIRGVTTGVDDAIPVLVDSEGQLGTVSSSIRFKQDVRELGETSGRLLALRPVSFRYRGHEVRPSG